MKAKLTLLSLVFTLTCLSVLFVLAFYAQNCQCQKLLMAMPKQAGNPGVPFEKIETICEEDFLLTYESLSRSVAEATNSRHSVTLVGTNSVYRDVMGYGMADGGFFTQSAWEAKIRHAVLNETAAFQLFHSLNLSGNTLRIGGEIWIVCGVIRDGDEENARIYLPSSITGGIVTSLMALLNETDSLSAPHILNTLKQLGIQESEYEIINLSQSVRAFWERALVALYVLLCLFLFFVIRHGVRFAWKRVLNLKTYSRKSYLREMLITQRKEWLPLSGVVLLLIAGMGILLFILLRILSICLTWQELYTNIGGFTLFAGKTEWLSTIQPAGITLFAITLFAIFTALLLAWKSKKPINNKIAEAEKIDALSVTPSAEPK